MTQLIVPCLWMDDQAEAAAAFYCHAFPNGRVLATSRYPESLKTPANKAPSSVLTVEFEIAGTRFTALNGGPKFSINPSISFFATFGSADEVDRVFGALADSGTALMPLGSYPWSPRYGWVKDRFGVSWQVMLSEPDAAAAIAPCFMFSDSVHGQARAAMTRYTGLFPAGRIVAAEEYTAQEGPAGTLKHARFTVAGQGFVATDSHIKHNIAFNEGISMQLMCESQAELDRYWDALCDGGAPSQCGWLKDRFGVSWQVVPRQLAAWLTAAHGGVRERVFQAVMGMTKLDIATLEAAARG